MHATLPREARTELALDQLVLALGKEKTERCAFCYGKLLANRQAILLSFRSSKDGEMGPRAAHVVCASKFLLLTDWLTSYGRRNREFEAARRALITGLRKIPATRAWDRRKLRRPRPA